jgi:hypothetical protein
MPGVIEFGSLSEHRALFPLRIAVSAARRSAEIVIVASGMSNFV